MVGSGWRSNSTSRSKIACCLTRWISSSARLTTLLFWLGNFAIKIYIAVIFAASIHGVVASTIVFMLWVYYSALIVLFGTRFTYVYAERYGTPIVPRRNMQRI
jgi:membrane protein